MRARIEFLGLCFDDVTLTEALARIEDFILARTPHKIFTPNVALLVWARRDPLLRRIYRTCDLVTVDGMAIYYALWLAGTPVKESLAASLLFYPLLHLAQEKGYRVYMLGAKEEVLRTAVAGLQRQMPRLQIVGARNGYFDDGAAASVAEEIRRVEPDILLLGMSTPVKEQFADKYLSAMNVPVTLGVGGMFDIAAGLAKSAPSWVRRLCLEWLYRLLQEPRRMWRRYLTTNTVFLWLLLKVLVRRRVLRRAE